MARMIPADEIPGLTHPWVWIEPRTDAELIERLLQAAKYNVLERERENLCSVAAHRLLQITKGFRGP
jgi:hypothetical protein